MIRLRTRSNISPTVVAFENPNLVTHLITVVIPTMFRVVVQVQRLAHVVREYKVCWFAIPGKIKRSVISECKREVSHRTEKRPPDTS